MRPVFFAWRFPELAREQAVAERRSRPVELRRVTKVIADARSILETVFGPGSVLKNGVSGEAQAPADRLTALADLAERLRPLVGISHWGVGASVEEAQRASLVAEQRRALALVWSSTLEKELDLKKSEAAAELPAVSAERLTPAQIEARFREHADRYAARAAEQDQADTAALADRRQRAATALERLRQSGALAQLEQKDPEAYAEVLRLAQAAQERLAKGGTFHGLPLPRKLRLEKLPPGTRVKGKVKVQTAEGEKWLSGRKGLVAAPEPVQAGGSVGHPEGAGAAR